jgi:membrane protein implicated in regulation of membrane protease activity
VVVGLALYGAATLRAGVLASWCGWALIVVPPIASLLNSKVFYGSIALFGVLWVALGYVLWSQSGRPSERPSRVR